MVYQRCTWVALAVHYAIAKEGDVADELGCPGGGSGAHTHMDNKRVRSTRGGKMQNTKTEKGVNSCACPNKRIGMLTYGLRDQTSIMHLNAGYRLRADHVGVSAQCSGASVALRAPHTLLQPRTHGDMRHHVRH